MLNRAGDVAATDTAKFGVLSAFFPSFFTNEVSKASVQGEVQEADEDDDRNYCENSACTAPWGQIGHIWES